MATYTPRMVVRRSTRKLAQAEGKPRRGRPATQGKRTLVMATDLATTFYRSGYATYLGSGPNPVYASEVVRPEVVQKPSTTALNATPNAPIDK